MEAPADFPYIPEEELNEPRALSADEVREELKVTDADLATLDNITSGRKVPRNAKAIIDAIRLKLEFAGGHAETRGAISRLMDEIDNAASGE